MKIINLYSELKKNDFITNSLLILVLLYPVSVVAGPALIEITIFFSIIISIYIFKFHTFKEYFFKFDIKFLIFFFIISILSSFVSEYSLFSLKSSIFSLRFFLFSVIILMILEKFQKFREIFLLVSLFFLIFCVLDGYFQLLFGKNIFLYNTNSEIITGLFFDEKKLGRYLVTFSPILIGIYLSVSKNNINIKFLLCLLLLNLIFFIVLFTSERVSMFYISFTIFVTIIYASKISKKYLLFFLIPLFTFFATYNLKINYFHDTVQNSINQITDNNKSFSYPSKQHRAFIFTSYKLFKQNPIIGVGPNNYRNKCKEIIYNNINNCSTHPHNILFQILSETGLLGLIIYLYFLVMILKKILNLLIFKSNLNFKIFFLLPVLYFINPFFPSGNFFNNWYMAIGTFSLPFYIYFNDIEID